MTLLLAMIGIRNGNLLRVICGVSVGVGEAIGK